MKFKFLKAVLTSAVLVVSSFANAGLIAIADWHDPTASTSGGLRQAEFDQSVFFAVAKDIDFSQQDTYQVWQGYHIATFAEYNSLYDASNNQGNNTYVHYGQDGWSGYTKPDGTSDSYYFAFADMWDNTNGNKVCHAGTYERYCIDDYTYATSWGNNLSSNPQYFGGLVLIKNSQSNEVPEPSILAIFALGMIGLASRKFKKKS